MKQTLKLFKNIILISTFTLVFAKTNFTIVNAQTMYENVSNETVIKGVNYEKTERVTENGLLDIYALRVDISNPDITLSPVVNHEEYGKKMNVLNLLTQEGAVAGVNSDYFGMAGNYSASFGPEIKNGSLLSISSGFNQEKNEYASFYLEKDNNPFILYLKPTIEFTNNGKKNINVLAINKITDMVFPIIVNQQIMENTKTIDDRFSNTLKIVVEEGKITYKSKKGETVNVPENGYVLVIGENSVDYFQQFFDVGQSANLKVTAGVDFNKIETAIGGAGRILLNGKVVDDTGLRPAGRQPRTTIGISEDKKQIVIICVDGRGSSVGVTNNEMADILKSYGAYNAMHLDGGGSTSMVKSSPENPNLTLVNNPSDGSMRKVMNALGVFNTAEVGPISNLVIKTNENGFVGTPVLVDIYGTDDNLRRININRDDVVINSDDSNGKFDGKYFYPSKTGDINFIASFENVSAKASTNVKELAELRPSVSTISVPTNGSQSVSFTGVATDGSFSPIISGVSYTVIPETLGKFENGTFTATSNGTGYIQASVGNISTFIKLSAGGTIKNVDSFEVKNPTKAIGYPKGVTSDFKYITDLVQDGVNALQLSYNFLMTSGTQAAYLVFDTPIEIPGKPVSLNLQVNGDNSGNWLRGKIVDSDGVENTIDFSNTVNWEGFKTTTAIIPSNVKFPIVLERIYVATLAATDENKTGKITFDNLQAVYANDLSAVELPPSPKFQDSYIQDLSTKATNGSYDITIIGDTLIENKDLQPDNYKQIQEDAITTAKKNSSELFFSAVTDYDNEIETPNYKYKPEYNFNEDFDDFAVARLTASKGGLISTDAIQWKKLTSSLAKTQKKNIIILIDKNPANFNSKAEADLLNTALSDVLKSKKRIFVVSSEGSYTTNKIQNGIRYINLGSLFEKEKQNNGFTYLRFRLNNGELNYEIQK